MLGARDAVCQPASSGGSLGTVDLPARSKPHISHSQSAELLRKVQRGHSHSSFWAGGVDMGLAEISGFRDMLVIDARVGGAL